MTARRHDMTCGRSYGNRISNSLPQCIRYKVYSANIGKTRQAAFQKVRQAPSARCSTCGNLRDFLLELLSLGDGSFHTSQAGRGEARGRRTGREAPGATWAVLALGLLLLSPPQLLVLGGLVEMVTVSAFLRWILELWCRAGSSTPYGTLR